MRSARLSPARWGPFALVATLACGGPQRDAAPSKRRAEVRLTVLSINDFHGQIDARSVRSGERPPRALRVGGAEALAATIAGLRAQNPSGTVLLDGGDFMQGSMVSNRFEGAPVRALYELLGVDATVIGNHEFDFGPVGPQVTARRSGEDPRGALRAWIAKAPFPVLSANLKDATGRRPGWKNLHAHTIVERAGLRIGVVGLTTATTPETTLRANVADLRFGSLRDHALREAAALRRLGVDALLLLAHAGGACRGDAPSGCEGEVIDLVRSLPPRTFDAVIAAHSHRCIRHLIAGTPVVEACALGAAVARVDLVVAGDRATRPRSTIFLPRPVCEQIFASSGDCEASMRQGPQQGAIVPNPLLTRHRALVQRVQDALAPFRDATRPLEQRILARFARPLHHHHNGGSEVGYLFAEMMRAAVPGADVAIVNGGGLRGAIAAGPFRYGDLYRIFPFDNRLATIRIKAKDLERLIAASLARPHAGVMQASGIAAQVRCNAKGQRTLESLRDARGRPFPEDRELVVVLADFLLAGGDGLAPVVDAIPAARKRVFAERRIRDEMARYLAATSGPLHTAQAPVLTADTPSVRVVGDGCPPPKPARHPLCR